MKNIIKSSGAALLSVVTVGLFLSACTPQIKIGYLHPPRVNIGKGRTIGIHNIVDTVYPAGDLILNNLIGESGTNEYFRVEDRLNDKIGVMIMKGKPWFTYGGKMRNQLDREDVDLVLDIQVKHGTNEERSKTETVTVKDSAGNKSKKSVEKRYLYTELLFYVTLVDKDRNVYIDKRIYGDTVSTDLNGGSVNKRDIMDRICREAVQQLYSEFIPQWFEVTTILDNSDSEQKGLIKLITREKYDDAILQYAEFIKANPGSGAALYNYAVALDAAERYEEALENYEKAIAVEQKELYVKTKKSCESRLQAKKTLQSLENNQG